MNLSQRLYHILRIACAMCFIGHGVFGIITKAIWCNYFGVFGIGKAMAYDCMPVVGTVDILLGSILLFYPIRAVAGWLVFWGLFTASLRPLSGEPFAEFLERAGNYGAPLALLMLSGVSISGWRSSLKRLDVPAVITDDQIRAITIVLQIMGCTLLVGHGWLNLIEKKGLIDQYRSLGFANPSFIAHVIGSMEIAGAALILLKPIRQLVWVLFAWKMISELFYPSFAFFEWVERGGSYAILLGLWLILPLKAARERHNGSYADVEVPNDTPTADFKLSLVMKISIVFIMSGVTIGCQSNETLNNSEVKRKLETSAYPGPVKHRIYCGDTETAKIIREHGLENDGLVTVQIEHTLEDIGQPLIRFTEAAKPYLLPTSDTLKSIDVQLVRIADEHFIEVKSIIFSSDKDKAHVEFTTMVDNRTPFEAVLDQPLNDVLTHHTSFTHTDDGWKWDKVIR